ncbi:hypothetical protein JKP88DRAFT_299849 [Tribonema minus]|uniref:Uncharacterized protein n=1 Tax=Tribonema minus TaxID=303371 RepID=A0A836CLU4_9STRA|nr:hypothetical protein JKP88DRAFT_299849 [Tribonema minus]
MWQVRLQRVLSLLLLAGPSTAAVARAVISYHASVDAGDADSLSIVDSQYNEQLLPLPSGQRYHNIIIDPDTRKIYWATDSTIEVMDASGSDRKTLLAGWVTIKLVGYNLGTSEEDVLQFTVRGVPCQALYYESANSVSCSFAAPAVAAPDAAATITAADVTFATRSGTVTGGYHGAFVEHHLADHSASPIITGLSVERRAQAPYALALDAAAGALYWSNHAARTIERMDAADGSALAVLAAGVGKVCGMVAGVASDGSSGGGGGGGSVLYYSSADRGHIARMALRGAAAGAREEVLAAGLQRPMGIALDTDAAGGTLYFAHGGGTISKLALLPSAAAGATAPSDPAAAAAAALAAAAGAVRTVLQRGTLARIDGVALAAAATADPGELRLYWAESGARGAVARASVYGTDVEILVSDADDAGGGAAVLWPRGVALGAYAGGGTVVAFTEYLSRLRVLSAAGSGGTAAAAILVDEACAAKAKVVERAEAGKSAGVDGALFLEVVV